MGRQPIITISGRAGAGKDTLAKLLVSAIILHTGKVPTITRFAGPLKGAAEVLFGATFDDREVKEVAVPVKVGSLLYAAGKALGEAGVNCTDPDVFGLVLHAFDVADKSWDDEVLCSPRRFQQLLGTEVGRTLSESLWADRVYEAAWEAPVILTDARFDNELSEDAFKVYVYNPRVAPVENHPSEHLAQYLEDAYKTVSYTDSGTYAAMLITGWGEFYVANNTADLGHLNQEALHLAKEFKAWLQQ